MDAGYDALEEAASSFAKVKESRGEDDGRSHRHRDDRDRDRDREHDRERRHRDRDGRDREERPRDRDGRGGEERPRDRDRERDREHRDRHRERDGERDRDRERERDGRDRYDRSREEPPRRRRREEDDFAIAEPMGGHRDRRPRYDEEPYAQPMRPGPPSNDPPPMRWRGNDDGGGGGGGGYRGGYGGGGRGRGGGGDRGGGGRRGHQTPPRSPTPPGTTSLEDRDLPQSLWDIAPPQFEGIGAMEAKMTGMFTYGPGRIPPPQHLGIPAGVIAGSFPPSGLNPMRQSKRIYIGNITDSMTEDQLLKHFNKLMHEKKLTAEDTPGDPISTCTVNINKEQNYAYFEFRSSDEATAAMELDGTMLDDVKLQVARPKDFVGIDPELATMGLSAMGGDSPNKLFIGGLPTYLNDEQVMELLKSFGELKSFNLVKEGTGKEQISKGFAFAEYFDPTVTDMAIQGLHNFQLGDRVLVVQRAAIGRNTGVPAAIPGTAGYLATAMPNILSSATDENATSRVIMLLNMVTPEELYDEQDYQEIFEDINEECSKYGDIEGVKIPRPIPKKKGWEAADTAAITEARNKKMDEISGVGRVYVMYKDIESAGKAMKAIAGRQFGGRTILVASVSEDEFLGPAPPPPPPEDLDVAAANALNDIMAGLT